MIIKKRIYRRIISATAALLLTTSNAWASIEHNASRDLLQRTGITVQMHSLIDRVDESSLAHATRCGSTPASSNITGFNAESIIFDTLSTFNKTHTRSIKPVENWYNSALALKIQIAEKEIVEYSTLTSFVQSARYKNTYRAELIGHIVDNMQINRFVAILGTEVEYAGIVHSGCIEKSANENSTYEQTLANITREDKDLTAMLLRGDIVAETAYLFRSLSDEELARYAEFTSSDAGLSFYSSLVDAIQESLQRAGDRLSNSLQNDLYGSIDF